MNMKKLLLLALLPFMTTACGFEIVDTGHRGVELKFGEVVSESLPEGFYMYNPITSDIVELDIRTQRLDFGATSYSKDAQIVEVKVTANLNLNSTAAHTTYKEVGFDWAEKLVPQIIHSVVKDTVGKYVAVDLITNRKKVADDMEQGIRARLAERNILLTSLDLSNLDFDNDFEDAVKKKIIAVEQAKEAKNKTVRIAEEAKQQVIAAKAEAESMAIKNESLSKNKALIEYEAVLKWDGVLPTMMMGNGSVPFINIDPTKKNNQ